MAAATPSGTASNKATNATMIEPTSKGRMPYQSCQKLAVTQFGPKRNDVIARYAGTGVCGSQARRRCRVPGNPAKYSRTLDFHCANDLRAFASASAGGETRSWSIL